MTHTLDIANILNVVTHQLGVQTFKSAWREEAFVNRKNNSDPTGTVGNKYPMAILTPNIRVQHDGNVIRYSFILTFFSPDYRTATGGYSTATHVERVAYLAALAQKVYKVCRHGVGGVRLLPQVVCTSGENLNPENVSWFQMEGTFTASDVCASLSETELEALAELAASQPIDEYDFERLAAATNVLPPLLPNGSVRIEWGSLFGDIEEQTDLVEYIQSQVVTPTNTRRTFISSGAIQNGTGDAALFSFTVENGKTYSVEMSGIRRNTSGISGSSGFSFTPLEIIQTAVLSTINVGSSTNVGATTINATSNSAGMYSFSSGSIFRAFDGRGFLNAKADGVVVLNLIGNTVGCQFTVLASQAVLIVEEI
jgi:hypothetical protein